MNKIAYLFPGQGAQFVGMGQDFYRSFFIAKETFQEANDRLGWNLSKLIFNGPSSELTLTKFSQVAIYVTSIAIWRVLKQIFPNISPWVVAGLSLGEYCALTASNRLAFEDGIDLVQERGLSMHAAGVRNPGTMRVILGLSAEEVRAIVDPIEGVWIGNLNAPGQVVISGTLSGVEKATSLLKNQGAKRALPLDVSGAFHSRLMQSAQERLTEKIRDVALKESSIKIVMNACGYFTLENDVRQNLMNQVVSTVHWEKGIRKMDENGVDLFIEIGPGKTLAGINRKIGVKGRTFSIQEVVDLETLRQGMINGIA